LLRFTRSEIQQLVHHFDLESLHLPHRINPPNKGEFILCAVLARLAYPTRLDLIQHYFGRSYTLLSLVINAALQHLVDRYKDLLEWHPMYSSYEKLRIYARTINAIGDIGDDCIWGFIDGTFKSFCRPGRNQREFYSGYKKAHGQKLQAICSPDGIIGSISGPYSGKVNDFTMVLQSGIEKRLDKVFEGKEILYIYGDPAYKALTYIIGPYLKSGRILSREKKQFNTRLSGVRISIEQAFGKAFMLWQANSFRNGFKAGSMPVGAYLYVAILLTNCHTCFRGSTISNRFKMKPPSIENYLWLR